MAISGDANWSDFVFNKDYDLMPLNKVESFVKKNKHLPEVPSAKEMEESGLNLKEMNLLLLKKVEELTLHVIEMKKENDQLSEQVKQIDYLRKEIEQLKSKTGSR